MLPRVLTHLLATTLALIYITTSASALPINSSPSTTNALDRRLPAPIYSNASNDLNTSNASSDSNDASSSYASTDANNLSSSASSDANASNYSTDSNDATNIKYPTPAAGPQPRSTDCVLVEIVDHTGAHSFTCAVLL